MSGGTDEAGGDTTATSPLRNRPFRRFLLGRLVTNAGDSLFSVAVLWLVFDLSSSTAVTGVASALTLLPFVLQVLGGPLVDRLPTGPLLVGSQLLQGAVVLVLPLAAATGHLSVPLLLAAIPVVALASVVMDPIETTVVPHLLGPGQVSRGNSLLATVTLGLDVVFEAVGGGVVALVGAPALFVADAATFGLATVCFLGMGEAALETDGSADPAPLRTVLREFVADLREGVALVRGTPFVAQVGTSAGINLCVGATLAVLPAIGDGLGGPAVYGLLLGGLGVGRVAGAWVAPWLTDRPFGVVMGVASLVSAAAWYASSLAGHPLVVALLFGLAWVPSSATGVLVSTLNQRAFPESVLGRVSTLKGTASGLLLPVGSLVGGAAGEVLGATTVLGLGAAGFLARGVYFLCRRRLRTLPAVARARPADLDVHTDAEPASPAARPPRER